MAARDPIATFATHEVINQVPALESYNLFERDTALRDALHREGAGWAEGSVRDFGAIVGSERVIALGFAADRHEPELRTFDRQGRRVDEVDFHPAYHELMALALAHGLPSVAWTADRPGGHVVHTALTYLFIQAETGVCCPMAMTYAGVAALRNQPDLAAEWEPRLLSRDYDPRAIPAAEKTGATIGMAMTEKQGGSDVRANTTRAEAIGAGAFRLTGHKWFCSAPMSDAFLTLAYSEGGLSCFLAPRWCPDGSRNPILIQRLKDKLGNRSNASSEIEYDGTWARMVGEEGHGVRTILDMVHHTRLDTALAPAGMMRQALVQAIHHARHRSAFQRRLIQQPLMTNVLADLALECEAATALVMRVARAFDRSAEDKGEHAFARIAVAIAKYWLNKRVIGHIYEAMECLGGGGYVEESILPRLYREAPVNSIWEGSGNVICLDVLRALRREPGTRDALMAEIVAARGGDRRLDAAIDGLEALLADEAAWEPMARRLVETMALCLQGALLTRHAPPAVADGFCAARLSGDGGGRCYGTLPAGVAIDAIIARSWPAD